MKASSVNNYVACVCVCGTPEGISEELLAKFLVTSEEIPEELLPKNSWMNFLKTLTGISEEELDEFPK